MFVTLTTAASDFIPWRPSLGKVFTGVFAFDAETTLIDVDRPWITPGFVLGAAYDGRRGFFITREHVRAFFSIHSDAELILHNAAFDLGVLQAAAPSLDFYQKVEQNQVWDTRLLHRLYVLGKDGHTAGGRGQSTLEHCAQTYLGCDLPKDVVDSEGNSVRLSYGRWLNRPPEEIEPVYLEYLAKDVMATFHVFEELDLRLEGLLQASASAFGFVSTAWLSEQAEKWGWQTHHIQLKAAIALQAIEANGLHVDLARSDELREHLDDLAAEKLAELRKEGYSPGQTGAGKALQEILKKLERKHPSIVFERTEQGALRTAAEALEPVRHLESFVDALLKYQEVHKLRSTYLGKMAKQRLHPRFDVLKNTGRTSCFGDINAQNLPRDDRVRSCFIPPPGHVVVDADYAMIEMVTLAQSVGRQFGVKSKMAAALNEGKDLHRLVAARVANKPEHEVDAEERRKAKAINFGKPGGMGNATLQQYAKATYGVDLNESEVGALSQSWLDLFPEMETFLADNSDVGLAVAKLLDLTPATHFEHTGDGWVAARAEGDQDEPSAMLGWMCLKSLKLEEPTTRAGRPYAPAGVDYFWSQVQKQVDLLPRRHRSAVLDRRPSFRLAAAVRNLADRGAVFTLTGRLRANASFCARHNTVFQGLAADGAKLGLWKLFRAGYHVVNFIHDEVLVAVPMDGRLGFHAARIRHLLIEGMREVVPDVRVDVTYSVTDRWHKEGGLKLDNQGRLAVWTASITTAA